MFTFWSSHHIVYSNLNKGTSEKIKLKIREELKAGLRKDKILNNEDSLLLRNFFNKIKLELDNVK